jgi:hypothetical protein
MMAVMRFRWIDVLISKSAWWDPYQRQSPCDSSARDASADSPPGKELE